MSIIQVAREGSAFVVKEDGNTVPGSRRETRGEAIKFAIDYKQNQ